jgi:hypothetical protein
MSRHQPPTASRLGLWLLGVWPGAALGAVSFHHNFEGGSLGLVEQIGSDHFRCHVVGQTDYRGRNRQATWYYFRIDGVAGRTLRLSLTNLVGEYNDRPGAVAMGPDTIPVYSLDNLTWQHFPSMDWDPHTKQATVALRVEQDSVWVAHVPPYPLSRLEALLAEVKRSPHAQVQAIGQSVQGRALYLVSIDEPAVGQATNPCVWVIARQHAWEAPTSFVLEGAIRFLISADPQAAQVRRRCQLKLVPTMDPDGLVAGTVRFNALGYDLNRHWDEVDPSQPAWRSRMPEIWHVKRALFDHLDKGGRIDLMLNLHNTETAEYLETQVTDPALLKRFERLYKLLVAQTSFDPSRARAVRTEPATDTNVLYRQRRVPVALMEQRIGFCPKLGRRPTVQDRLRFGRELVLALAQTLHQ